MGKCRFQCRAVPHNGICQIRKVFFPEERQRDFPQLLGQGNAPYAALYIRCQIGGIILKPGGGKDKHKIKHRAGNIKDHPVSVCLPVHDINDKIVEQPDGEHKRDILHNAGDTAFYQIGRPLP